MTKTAKITKTHNQDLTVTVYVDGKKAFRGSQQAAADFVIGFRASEAGPVAIAITELETRVLVAIRDNDFGNGPGDWVWSDCIDADGVKGRTLSGVCGSLAKKGLVEATGSGRDSCIRLTEAGIAQSATL